MKLLPDMTYGEDVQIADTAIFKRPYLAHLGNHVAIDDYCVFTTRLLIEDYVHIAPLCTVIGGADALFHMGNFTTMAAGCRIACASDEHKGAGLVSPVIPKEYRDNVIINPVILKDFASLASNVVLSPGVILEQGAVVGTNSWVKAGVTIPAWEIWAGNPAKKIGERPALKMLEYARALGYK